MQTNLKKKIRFVSLLVITSITYILSIVFLFVNYDIFTSILCILILFIAFHLLYLDIYKYNFKYLILILGVITILEIIFLGHFNFSLNIGIIAINTAIVLLANVLDGQTDKSTIFSGINYFAAGGYIFTMGITVAYSFVSVGMYNKFPLNCLELSNATNSVIESVTNPLQLGRDEVKKLQENTKTFFTSTVGDAINIGKNIELESTTPTKPGFIQNIKTRKEELINSTIKDNQELNRGICDFTLSKINEKLQSPGLQISVVIFIILLIYPFMRIVFYVMTVIGFILFEIFYLTRLYKKEKTTKEVDIIE